MLDLLVVTLLQAAAGAPAEPAAAPTPAAIEEPMFEEPAPEPEMTEAERRREAWRDRQRCRARSSGAGRLGAPTCASRRSDREVQGSAEPVQSAQGESFSEQQ